MTERAMGPDAPGHSPTSPTGSAPVWLYDGYCVFCSRWVLFVLRREETPLIRFVAFQSDEGRLLAELYGIDPDDTDSFLFIDGGKTIVKSDGVAAVCARLRRPWSFAAFMTVVPRPLRDWVYDRIASNRHLLTGKRDFCMAPPPEWCARVVAPETRH
jgi:predicted DCC family thiol-disulfide oxidoreductase YuxK